MPAIHALTNHGQAAGNAEHLAGAVAGLPASEKQDGGGAGGTRGCLVARAEGMGRAVELGARAEGMAWSASARLDGGRLIWLWMAGRIFYYSMNIR